MASGSDVYLGDVGIGCERCGASPHDGPCLPHANESSRSSRMRVITVTALHPQEYDGRKIDMGEAFTVTPIEAASLKYRGRVMLGLRDTPAKPIRKRRAYKRRDLVAED